MSTSWGSSHCQTRFGFRIIRPAARVNAKLVREKRQQHAGHRLGLRQRRAVHAGHQAIGGAQAARARGQSVVPAPDEQRGQRRQTERGMPGFAPTQGHLASALCYVPHALDRLTTGEARKVMMLAKGTTPTQARRMVPAQRTQQWMVGPDVDTSLPPKRKPAEQSKTPRLCLNTS